jgi:hypothetical protein
MGRDKLALFLPNREAIKAFEHLVEDVATTLPDAVLDSATAAEAAAAAAAAAQADADAAALAAAAAQVDADAAQVSADAAGVVAAAAQVDADDALAQLAALVLPLAGSLVVTVPGPAGQFEHAETLAAVGVTASHRVLLALAAHSDSDENNEQALDMRGLAGEAGTDTITVRLAFGSLTSGPIRINYMAV